MLLLRRKPALILSCVVAVAATVWLIQRRADREPSYGGKTVTEWLDCMALFDDYRYPTNETRDYKFPPGALQKDPALQALLHLGPQAVPVLVQRLAEPPEPERQSLSSRAKDWWKQTWRRFRQPGALAPGPAPLRYSSSQKARNMAAAFTLMALGTNRQGGFTRAMEANAAAPAPLGIPGGISMSWVVPIIRHNLPEREAEIIAGIQAGLRHPNAECRCSAANSVAGIIRDREPIPGAQDALMELTQDEDERVRQSALWALVTTDPRNAAVLRLAEAVLRERTNSARFRAFAATGIGFAREKAVHLLPVLREAAQEPDTHLQREATEAIKRIEHTP